MKKRPKLILLIHSLIFILLFLTPLIYSDLFVFLTMSKTFLLYLVAQIVFFLWLYLALVEKEYRPKNNILIWFTAGFLFIYTVSAIFGINPEYSFWGSLSRTTGLITIYHVALLALVLYSTVKDSKTWNVLLFSISSSAMILSIFSFLSFMGIKFFQQFSLDLGVTAGNSSYAGTYLLIGFFVSIYLIKQSPKFRGQSEH